MVMYVYERDMCMVRLLKLVEMTETFCTYPDLISSPPIKASQSLKIMSL